MTKRKRKANPQDYMPSAEEVQAESDKMPSCLTVTTGTIM
jgi:hypothetical protein